MTLPVESAAAAAPTVQVIQPGGWFKADIKKVSRGSDHAILKDFSDKTWPVRLLGRRQVAQEIRALRRLQGIPGVPRCYGEAAGGAAVLMEPIEGEPITRWCRRHGEADAAAMFERLARLVAAMHARGVAHIDLRKRDNILVTAEGMPCVIDFNASFCFDPEGAATRLLFPLLRRVDESAVLKWKALLAPGLLSDDEQRRHRWMSRLRRLWIFN